MKTIWYQRNFFRSFLSSFRSNGTMQQLESFDRRQLKCLSLYFLQNGDHPGLILVSHPFMEPNFNTWNRAMRVALTAKNKISFIDGSIRQPTKNDLFNSWTRCNSMVLSWILNSVVKEIADSLIYIEIGAEIWNDLHNRFHQSNGPRIF